MSRLLCVMCHMEFLSLHKTQESHIISLDVAGLYIVRGDMTFPCMKIGSNLRASKRAPDYVEGQLSHWPVKCPILSVPVFLPPRRVFRVPVFGVFRVRLQVFQGPIQRTMMCWNRPSSPSPLRSVLRNRVQGKASFEI